MPPSSRTRYSRPFLVTFSGVAGESAVVWQADQGAFVLDSISARSTALIDLNVCDSHVDNPIGSIACDTAVYRDMKNSSPIESVNPYASRVILLDHQGVACTVKGYVHGWVVRR